MPMTFPWWPETTPHGPKEIVLFLEREPQKGHPSGLFKAFFRFSIRPREDSFSAPLRPEPQRHGVSTTTTHHVEFESAT